MPGDYGLICDCSFDASAVEFDWVPDDLLAMGAGSSAIAAVASSTLRTACCSPRRKGSTPTIPRSSSVLGTR